MASDSDDADFFDKLVDEDDEAALGDLSALTLDEDSDTGAPNPAAGPPEAAAPPPPEPEAAALPGVKAVASLPKVGAAAPPDAGAEAEAEAVPAALPEVKAVAAPPTAEAAGGSPGSGKGVRTAFKQVQWSVFTGSSSGADPLGDFLADSSGGEDAVFGASLTGYQGVQGSVVRTGSVGAADHSFSNGVGSNVNAQLDWGASAVESVDQNTSVQSEWTGGAVDSLDPKYLESLYPGWKYDGLTRQWYHVETFGAQGNVDNSGVVPVVGSGNVQQQPQHCSVSYLQNSSQAGLETIAEEGSTTAASWGQDESSAAVAEYPPNMLLYAEYPGWYFDTNTQQWHTLESYQQGVAQTATTAAALDGSAWTGHNLAHAGNSYVSNYNQHSQWRQGSLDNSMQPENLRDNSLVSSSYGSHQHAKNQIGRQANAQPLDSSADYQSGINTFVPSQHIGSEGHQDSFKGFEPTNYQSVYKSVEPSTSRQSTSTSHQSGYKGSEPSTGHHGFKPLANNQSYMAFVPSRGDQIGHMEFGPSIDSQASHVAHEPSTSHGYGSSNGVAKPKDFVPTAGMYQTQTHADPAAHMHLPNSYLGSENSMNFAQQQFIGSNVSSQQFGYSSHEQRSSAGRPPHALVAFGFGGKLVVVKETSSMITNFGSGNQANSCGTVSIINISEMVADKIDQPSIPNGSAISYFHALCHQPIPGPLVGGSAAAKDVNKWLDEIIRGCEFSVREFQGGDAQKLLISLLKILCQHYGKLRSPFGSDLSQEGVDGPEMAVTKLFSSCKRSSAHMREYGTVVHCMKNIPSENQIQATAQEVQNLLVSGRRKEALQYAQEGQLWGPALILALQLGDKFYADTVKKMAHCHFGSGSPLRTLCLLIAGQPADVFNVESPVHGSYGTLHRPQQPAEGTSKGMLDDWQENLAIITANRTKGDDLVITHLGDCLWKEKNEVAAAHSCYLVAELNIDSYSENARICLIGSDHLRCPRTFTSPEAIQRTELYEYAKVLGNSQYILLPFQPYKLIYAYMLAEVGKVSDSLRYCQASLKVLKASGRAPELEAWKQLFSSLEERIRTHQQGGYGTNLAPAKLVGKIFTSIDKSLSRMMGTQPASLPPLPQGSSNDRDLYSAPPAPKVVNSQSVMAMSSLMSSASEQSMSEMAGSSGPGRKGARSRSVSEPDFGRTPIQGAGSDNAQSTSGSGSSRFGLLLQKTMGFVSKPHHQAKLGEQNKFYYDEKLKRWVEEGAEIPAEEPPLPPPPTKAAFQNGIPDYNLNGPSGGGYTANGPAEAKPSNPSELSSGMPPMPPSQNQFSARGRMGVRSRYVDTFNKGGTNAFGAATATAYSKPATPSMNPLSGATFFVPTPAVVASEQMPDSTAHAHGETTHQDEPSPSPGMEASFASQPPPPVPMQSGMQRYPSMDNIMTPSGTGSANSSLSKSRAASWSGTYPDQLSSSAVSRSPDGQSTQSPLIPGKKPCHSRSNSNSSTQLNGLGEDLHEVEL